MAAVNALSDWLKLEIRRTGKVFLALHGRGFSTEIRRAAVWRFGL